MFCPNCGANIPDGTKFCPKCGGRIDEETPGRQKSAGPAQGNKTPNPGSMGQQTSQSAPEGRAAGSDSGTRKNLTPRIIGIIVAAVVVIAIIVVLIVVLSNNGGGGGSTTVDLNNYVEITAEGYDGYGTVSYVFDTTTFVSDYAEKVAYKTENGSAQPSVSTAQSLADRVADAGTFTVDEGLSNGDEITFSWNFNAEEIEELYDVNLKYDDIPYKVEGLEELEEVDILGEDVFEGVTVEFSGTSPQGTATINVSDSIDGVDSSIFTLSQSTWLSNGDTVTVSITEEGKEKLAERYGIVPTETEKEFTVEGLAYYPSDVSEIPEESFKTAWTRIQDDYSTTLENYWVSRDDAWDGSQQIRKLISMNYLGCYYFVNEETGTNELIFVYEMDTLLNTVNDNNNNEVTDPMNYYWFGYYSDVIIDEEGKWVVPSEYNSFSDMVGEHTFDVEYLFHYGNLRTYSKTYNGYKYLDEMTQAIKSALPEYTLINDTVSEKEDEETASEENNEAEEQAPEENNEGEGETPEENNEGEQQEGD